MARLPGEASCSVPDSQVVAGVVALARRLVARQLRRRSEVEAIGRGVARSQAAAREALCVNSARRNPRVQLSASTRATALALTIVLGQPRAVAGARVLDGLHRPNCTEHASGFVPVPCLIVVARASLNGDLTTGWAGQALIRSHDLHGTANSVSNSPLTRRLGVAQAETHLFVGRGAGGQATETVLAIGHDVQGPIRPKEAVGNQLL
mmetsp:Transcript_58672/g.191344  ORF Transcript_58672/g.191344 Transcript_58672/m.191344 type:complete len:207 (-) Transcript_58672:283-903(-)